MATLALSSNPHLDPSNDVARLDALLQDDPARANDRLRDGKTPVSFAIEHRSHDTLRRLLKSGADPNAGNLSAAEHCVIEIGIMELYKAKECTHARSNCK
jgi:hypothetical protein